MRRTAMSKSPRSRHSRAGNSAPKHPDAFEPLEIAEVEAELALAESKYQDADEKLKSVIA